ncbi:MAG: hypothetical protein QXD11_01015 [Candidatus Micrarchaeaceae archaeon]
MEACKERPSAQKLESMLIKESIPFAFVGGVACMENVLNAGGKMKIESDIDIMLLSNESIKKVEELLGEKAEKHYLLFDAKFPSYGESRLLYAPFNAYSFPKSGVDAFLLEDGIGAIRINESMMTKNGNKYVLEPSAIIATYINPLAVNQERMKKAAFALFSISNKFEEEVEKSHRIVLGGEDAVKKAVKENPYLFNYKCFSNYWNEYATKTPRLLSQLSGKILREADRMELKKNNKEKLAYYIESFKNLKRNE